MLQIDIDLVDDLIGKLHSAAFHACGIFLIADGANDQKRNGDQEAEQHNKLGAQRHID
ncbi:hypothetical protein D3C81_2145490 [compost metagenome]